ncbi:MAG: restriction endonuclease, partial [Caulobacteraceae bacterium]|nr:restriction endonuclease [Caulobacteraceae bacterium]
LCLVESKRWNRPLDRPADARDRRAGEEGVPSTQILRYLRRADDITGGALRWGMLTNGRLWRLYWSGAVSVSEDFLEIDLGRVLGAPGCEPDLLDARDFAADHALRLFLLLLGRGAFLPSEQGRTFHAVALEQGRRWEEKVARDLSRVVFDRVFPVLAAALAHHDRARPDAPDAAWLEAVRQGALILLYRLLFVLYAEDRDLLPDERGPYADYSLTRIRREVADARAEGRPASPRAAIYWARLKGVFTAIAHGDDALGVPPYNGGLFEPGAAPILERVELPDAVVAEIVFALSHVETERGPKYVNYRDLSVQQLGSIYERILEFGLRLDDAGEVAVDRDDDERHDSGSYYTPEALVSLIIDRGVGPEVARRAEAFAQAATRLASDRRPVAERLAELAAADPASALLELKVCDPAMGSGHFLVSLVDWLADRVLAAVAEASAEVTWGAYASPLLARVAAVRDRILAAAKLHGWPVTPEQLDDRHVVRRMILKRVVHGVDKNPFAVELAKVSLWLHTFTVGAPLSFLDHHLRCGDSVVGAWVRPTLDAVAQGGGLLSGGEVVRVEQIATRMTEIEETTDNDVAEVKASAEAFGAVADATFELDAFFSLMTARPALGVDLSPTLRAPQVSPDRMRAAGADARKIAAARKQQAAYDRAAAFKAVLGRQYGDPLKIASGEIVIATPDEDHDQPLLGGMS